MTIIDLSKAREEKQDRPDAEFIHYDDNGQEMRTYALTYEMDGGTWSAQIIAYSMKDAEARVQAMRQSLELRGEIHAIVS